MIDHIDIQEFSGTVTSDITSTEQQELLVKDLRIMALCVLEAILERFERGDCRFIDTKLSLVNGQDFPGDDPVCGRDRIYGWIQARGIEALAGHLQWLRQANWLADTLKKSLIVRMEKMLEKVVASFQALRRANNGRIFFVMRSDGTPLRMNSQGSFEPFVMGDDDPMSFSDIFGCKALAAASIAMNKRKLLIESTLWFQALDQGVSLKKFRSDQQPLDPVNPATRPVEGRQTHGPWMIAIGAAAVMLQATGDTKYIETGLRYIGHILANYTNLQGRFDRLHAFDMFEFIGPDGMPFTEADGAIRCDGGHACEFAGLSLKFIALAKAADTKGKFAAELKTAALPMADIIARNFANSFSAKAIGMHKGVDLLSGALLHPHMPWWPLPETFRAAVLAAGQFPARRAEMLAIATKAINAFFGHFVRPELKLMARQTLDADGQVVDAIPATPDADPAYHTGLSIIDALNNLTF